MLHVLHAAITPSEGRTITHRRHRLVSVIVLVELDVQPGRRRWRRDIRPRCLPNASASSRGRERMPILFSLERRNVTSVAIASSAEGILPMVCSPQGSRRLSISIMLAVDRPDDSVTLLLVERSALRRPDRKTRRPCQGCSAGLPRRWR